MGGIKIIMTTALALIILAGTGAAVSLSNSGGGTWKYQRENVILENSGDTLTDYQVMIDLKRIDFPSEALSNGADVRFADANGKELDYWIENWDYAGKNARIWVKVQNIPANGEAKIRMHYGNPSAISSSNGEATFDFFDDFEEASLNANKWLVQNGKDYAISGGKLSVGSRTIIRNTMAFSPPKIFEAKVSIPNNPTVFKTFFGAKAARNDPTGLRFATDKAGEATVTINNQDVLATILAADYNEKIHTIKWKSDEGVYQRAYSTVETHTSHLPTRPLYIHFMNAPEGQSGVNIVADWTRARKYTFPEPAFVSGLYIKKSASPYSIRQFKETIITVSLKNYGNTDARDVELMDSIHPKFDLIGGDFPNPKRYEIIKPGESKEIQYTIKAKESGNYSLDTATITYADSEGNIQEVKSEAVSIKVVPSSEGSPEISPPSDIGTSSAVLLHGEKTEVVLGEDILLKLSAVNLITKPPMSVQVMIYPPSGMSVTGSEFVKSGAGIYTTTYTLNPGDGKDIEVHIKSNQVGDFNVKGRIVYYFGEEKEKAEDHTLNLPIKVRKEPGQTVLAGDGGATLKAPGFAGEITIIGILFVVLFIKRCKANGALR